ncbi:BUD32 protein kinase [Tremella mesenterica]|uniref:non-specific serine/threonine protein kinase n=1 Tax=Tremella mesenterica TaxID=5217 RepID=A0A4Q1BMR3_TREME|nr:BUD32 protein kinase [Tremella mesenterica]
MTWTPAGPSNYLISQSRLIKQGAEARVYLLSSLLPSPRVYWPSDSQASDQTSSSQTLSLPKHSDRPSPFVDEVAYNTNHLISALPSSNTSTNSSERSKHKQTSHDEGKATQEVILKYRFPKTYRHPILDASLTRSRLAAEARALTRCAKAGVNVPQVLWVDEKAGVLGLERIKGWSVREILGGGAEGELEGDEEEELGNGEEVSVSDQIGVAPESPSRTSTEGTSREGEDARMTGSRSTESTTGVTAMTESGAEWENEGAEALRKAGITIEGLMESIGRELGRLHALGTVHGDLTTSNMMVRLTPGRGEQYEVVLIDFGLSSGGTYAEHYAVDLYVLERAFLSTHPSSESLYAGVSDPSSFNSSPISTYQISPLLTITFRSD